VFGLHPSLFLQSKEKMCLNGGLRNNMIDETDHLLSSFPYAGRIVEEGRFKGLCCLTYGKSRHRMLNYVIFCAVYENDGDIDVINILPARSKQKRIK
jgi:hypothetical protein